MPRRTDLKKILVVGAGPIIIGQACEFDYSGTQGAKALRAEGYEVVLVNSNPATIMTDPELADRTYVEPLTPSVLLAILDKERPDAILPTLGGQTALNLALALDKSGALASRGIELLGANRGTIEKAEDRALFKAAMDKIGLMCPTAHVARSVEDGRDIVRALGLPAILRPSFTLGGSGGGIVREESEVESKIAWALSQSPVGEVLIEESLLGWKEFELEVMRDRNDNFVVICSIENIDPMGVHTGDSITVAPAMTLTDREYQRLRDAARAIMTEIGVETGGANVQFAVKPEDGTMRIIEMNPRVSRSSALASKATGYPIAKIAAKLAVGYTLDELKNDITGTSAAFEPVLDYVVVKWPRFDFEKFPGAEPMLGPQMKSVGEAMAIGRSFQEALQKAARSLETGRDGMVSILDRVDPSALSRDGSRTRDLVMDPPEVRLRPSMPPKARNELRDSVLAALGTPTPDRLFLVMDALRLGVPEAELARRTSIDPWFLAQLGGLFALEQRLAAEPLLRELLLEAKRAGFSDRQIAALRRESTEAIREQRLSLGIAPSYLRIDTCAAELDSSTPYFYSSYEAHNESDPSSREKYVILGGGPNRIGQGIEFDYCCVHASSALRELGYETIMVNCNPETVSTDYDTSDRLYFEPLALENVLAILEHERPTGIIVQFGGQTPLKLAKELEKRGYRLLGTGADSIDRAEDRERFDAVLTKLGLRRPKSGIARTVDEALACSETIGYPVLVRPSYVLGGRAMYIANSRDELLVYVEESLAAAKDAGATTLLIDEFLRDAIEVDVDCVADRETCVIGGVMQHIEEAGVHSGDSASVLPPHSLSPEIVHSIEEQTRMLALELDVCGLMNVQFAVRGGEVYVLEVNPRASRSVPFVSKATGRPLARIAAKVMAGATLASLGIHDAPVPHYVAVKESVFPFAKFPGVDTILGPEMRSTGEVMGISDTFARAFSKAMAASNQSIAVPERPGACRAFLSVRDDDKPAIIHVARRLRALGYDLLATKGTAHALSRARIPCETVRKVREGTPHIVDTIRSGSVHMVVNTTVGAREVRDSYSLRRQTVLSNIPYVTTLAAALAVCDALESGVGGVERVRSLQEWAAPRG